MHCEDAERLRLEKENYLPSAAFDATIGIVEEG